MSASITVTSLVLDALNVNQLLGHGFIWQWWALGGFVTFAICMGLMVFGLQRNIDKLQRNLNNPSLQKAHSEHLTRIKVLIEDWNNSLVVPPISQVYFGTSPLIDTTKANALFINLKNHLPFEKLWQNNTIWDMKIREYLDICRKLRSEIYESWSMEGTKPAGNQFAEPILRLIGGEIRELKYRVFFAKGHTLEEIKYQVLNVNSTEVVRGLESPNQSLDQSDDRTLILPVEYDKLAVEFLCKDIVSKTKQLSHDLRELKCDMNSCLAKILERGDYINNPCAFCPIRIPLPPVSHKEGSQS